MALMRRALIKGFIVIDYLPRFPEGIAAMAGWLAEGKLQYRTDMVDGLENAVEGVNRLFDGANTGKLLVGAAKRRLRHDSSGDGVCAPGWAASKLPAVGTTIFTVMSQLAQAHGALNLSQGFPDFDGPSALLDRVSHYLHHGANQYAPMTGAPALREALAEKIAADYGAVVDPDQEITITSGATEALFCAVQAVDQAGDEVIFDPAYDSYDPAVVMAGARPVHLALEAPGFEIDFDALETVLSSRTRAVVINTPHNPTGTVLSEAALLRLGALAERYGFWILSDEVYEHIIFDGQRHESVLRHPQLAARSMVSSLGKTYHTTGWKIGYCVAPAALTVEFRKDSPVRDFLHAPSDPARPCGFPPGASGAPP